MGANPATEMRRPAYPRGVLGFSSIDPDQAFDTAASFVSNTNWQSYYGEQTMGHVVQTGGLAVRNFLSAAVGMAVAVVLVRGFARSRTGELGDFWAYRPTRSRRRAPAWTRRSPPQYADIQVHRIAKLNDLTVPAVQKLVDDHKDGRVLGFIGEPRVNVMELNIALKALEGA